MDKVKPNMFSQPMDEKKKRCMQKKYSKSLKEFDKPKVQLMDRQKTGNLPKDE